MLKIDDIRETRVYREALEEGREEERQKQLQRDRDAIKRLANKKMPPKDIAEVLGLQIEFVREELSNGGI